MKKIFFTIILLSVFLATNAQEASKGNRAETKARIIKNIITAENGDVVVNILPDKNFSFGYSDQLLGIYLYYFDPSVDGEKLSESIKKEAGNKRLIVDIMEGVSKYMASRGLNFQKVSPSYNEIKSKLDDGIPLFCYFNSSNKYGTDFLGRAKERSEAKDMKEWGATLRRKEITKFVTSKKSLWSCSIIGYNPQTKEIMVFGLAQKPIWMAEKELKEAVSYCYAMRF